MVVPNDLWTLFRHFCAIQKVFFSRIQFHTYKAFQEHGTNRLPPVEANLLFGRLLATCQWSHEHNLRQMNLIHTVYNEFFKSDYSYLAWWISIQNHRLACFHMYMASNSRTLSEPGLLIWKIEIRMVWRLQKQLTYLSTYFDEFEYFATGLESPSSSKSSGTGTNPL